MTKTFQDKLFSEELLSNINCAKFRADFGYYSNLSQLYQDILKMIYFTMRVRSSGIHSNIYLTDLICYADSLFRSKKRLSNHMKVYQEIINQQFEFSKVTFCKVPGNWNKTPFPKRNYEEVTQYLPMVAEKTTLDRMLTSKSSQCEG